MMSPGPDVVPLFSQASAGSVPWYFSNEVIGGVAGAMVAAAVTFFLTKWATRRALEQRNLLLQNQVEALTSDRDKSRKELAAVTRERDELQQIATKYGTVKAKLAESRVIRPYEQPVLLIGPRYVGKSSLLMQWHAPWDSTKLSATPTHRYSTVPVHDVIRPGAVPHFADPDVSTEVHAHLKLRVHDFPGDLAEQSMVIKVAQSETRRLREEVKHNLGVVLICMFDAVEAATDITIETKSYYNGELFANIRDMVMKRSVDVQRIILVFNKFDLLRNRLPSKSDNELLKLCTRKFEEVIESLHGAVNPERLCEAATVLDRENLVTSQGASVVLGEAARGLVEAVMDTEAARRLIGDGDQVTHFAADIFPALP